MPLELINRTFTDSVTDAIEEVYRANAGDKKTCRYIIKSKIEMRNGQGVTFQFDYVAKRVYVNGNNWVREGFAVGDSVEYIVYDPSGNVKNTDLGNLNQGTTTVASVTASYIELNDLDPSINFDDTYVLTVTGRARDEVHLYVNHKPNDEAFDRNSHIDGEATILTFSGLALAGGGFGGNFTQIGNQSGQFRVSTATLLVETKTATEMTIIIEFDVIQSGVYDETPFFQGNWLNLSNGFRYFSLPNDPNTAITFFDEYQSNTGWYDDGYADEQSAGEVTTPIDVLYFNAVTPFTAVIEMEDAGFTADAFGSSYVPQDADYFKNKIQNQSELGICQETFVSTGWMVSNPANGAGYTIDITASAAVGTTLTIDGEFTPNTEFTDFMLTREDTDRLFRLWVKVDNTNILIYNGQLQFKAQEDEPFVPSLFTLNDAEDNVLTGATAGIAGTNTEDSMAAFCDIDLTQGEELDGIGVRIFARRSTGEEFDLQSDYFDLTSAVMFNGYYNINIEVNKPYNLASGSVRNKAVLFVQDAGVASYRLSLMYPFLTRWETWLPLQADAEFYNPNVAANLQNGNQHWFQYDNTVDWDVFLEVSKDYGLYKQVAEVDVKITDYNADANVTSTITLKREDGTPVTALVQGEVMTVTCTHESVGADWDATPWQEVTVEPFEGSPRWQASTLYANGNAANPLQIVSSGILGDTATMVATLDTNKINTSNGVSISAKIKGTAALAAREERIKETFKAVVLPSLDGDEEERSQRSKCCVKRLVLASIGDAATERNDINSAWVKLGSGTDSVTFTLKKNGVATTYQPTAFDLPSEDFGKYCSIEWRQALTTDGAGCYALEVSQVLAGISFDYVWETYELRPFSYHAARNTVRMRCTFDKYHQKEDINFRYAEVVDDFRFKGMFGFMQPKTQVDNLIYTDRTSRTITRENLKEYQLKSKLIEPRYVRLLVDLYLLNGTQIEVSDYNAQNPDFLLNVPVILSKESQGAVLEYYPDQRKRTFEATFTSALLNEKNYLK